ncbi:hypothetical protein MKZ38_010742 [Zalerion maritima]|uniref:DUF7137 domain-containing protein n=1 Tax=Zalerion maritima TaxID=339359 RepID=A0AAD5WVR7_9PEZI|nr:hypothetical protein MKZ38_010742 [Zalerion maritima]
MHPARSFSQVAVLLLGVSTITAAWPNFLPPMDALVARQDDGEDSTTTAKAAQTSTADADSSTITSKASLTTGNLNTATFNSDDTATTGSGNSTSKKTFDSRSPAGGVSMIQPITTTMVLYKLGDYATFSWNYTSLLASPTAVDVLAVDSSASQTHTLTQNMTFEIPASYTWDTEAYQDKHAVSKGLRVAEYTLYIYDSEGEPTGTAAAGYLAPYNSLNFGIYTPQPYEPLGSWVCAVCNSAPGKASAAGLAITLAFGAGVAIAVL